MALGIGDGLKDSGKGTQSSRSKRGKVVLNELFKRKAKGVKLAIEFNKYGQPLGKPAAEMQSYIGKLTREHVRVTYKTWKEVPDDVKDMIWESIDSSYDVPEQWKEGCLDSSCQKWRTWKTTLANDFIYPYENNPTKLQKPPAGSGIDVGDWNQFVLVRLSPDFKKLRAEQQERRSKNLYPHRLSRKGYARLAEDIKDELNGDVVTDKAIWWKKARLPKDGQELDESLKTLVQKIDHCILKKKEGIKPSADMADALTYALDKPEHSGRTRGMGAYVTPTTLFKCPRERRANVDEKSLLELEDAKKRIELQDTRLQDQDSRLKSQNEIIHELMDRIGKIENAQGAKVQLVEEKGSCSGKISHYIKEEDEDEVMLIDKATTLQGKAVKLMLGDTKTIVGYGTVVATGDKLHGVSMPKNCLRVSIDDVVDDNALLPFRVSDEITTIGSAVATHVAWPTKLIAVKDEASIKRKYVEKDAKVMKVKCLTSLPSSLKALYCMMDHSFNGRGLHIAIDVGVFGMELDIWILLEPDVIPLCNLEPITGNCIVSYVWYLYRTIQKSESKDRFLFVNPFVISYKPKVSREDRARGLACRLLSAAPNQLVLVPCNVGEHWILTIIDPYKELVYLMDPLSHHNRDASWKSVVETAMTIFNANKAKNIKKPPSWVVVQGPIQPDSKQCGFYVM